MANELLSSAIDVTALIEEAAPDLLRRWGPGRVMLIADQGAEANVPTLCVPRLPRYHLVGSVRRRPAGGLAPGTLRRVRQFVEQHLAEPVSLGDLSRVAGLSACHFSRAFKQSVGIPPRRYLTLRRVARAMELIRDSDRPLAELCLDAGFTDQSHLTRCFVAVTGSTPRDFRREIR